MKVMGTSRDTTNTPYLFKNEKKECDQHAYDSSYHVINHLHFMSMSPRLYIYIYIIQICNNFSDIVLHVVFNYHLSFVELFFKITTQLRKTRSLSVVIIYDHVKPL